MERCLRCARRRWKFYLARWTCTYEARLGNYVEPDPMGTELAALPDCGTRHCVAGYFPGRAQTRLLAARAVPAHRLILRRQRGGEGRSGVRPHADIIFHVQPREPV